MLTYLKFKSSCTLLLCGTLPIRVVSMKLIVIWWTQVYDKNRRNRIKCKLGRGDIVGQWGVCLCVSEVQLESNIEWTWQPHLWMCQGPRQWVSEWVNLWIHAWGTDTKTFEIWVTLGCGMKKQLEGAQTRSWGRVLLQKHSQTNAFTKHSLW